MDIRPTIKFLGEFSAKLMAKLMANLGWSFLSPKSNLAACVGDYSRVGFTGVLKPDL